MHYYRRYYICDYLSDQLRYYLCGAAPCCPALCYHLHGAALRWLRCAVCAFCAV